MQYVEQRGCQFVQGFLTGRPMAAHTAMAALKERTYAALMTDEPRQVAQ
jgi:EAL domain-containing protein (putative c-di-GMP-specific phosphodiesterase class I)